MIRAGSALALIFVASQLAGCCTSGPCLDKHSSADKSRVRAVKVKLARVINDSVSSPDRDRTDWKFLDLKVPGRLTADLHWDKPAARLELAVFDVMGVLIQQGKAWGTSGLRAAVVIKTKGRYLVRVRAMGAEDGSNYALRVRFKSSGGAAIKCHDCAPDERKCLGKDSYIICESVSKGCNAWRKTVSCPAGVACSAGKCGACINECQERERRCTAAKR